MQWEVPADWVYLVHGDQLDLYKRETTRVVYDRNGMVLCGSEMPQIELRRDKGLSQRSHQSYNFLFVLPSPNEVEDTFSDPMLLDLQWETQLHKSGEKVLLPALPGPFGDVNFEMLGRFGSFQHSQAWLRFHCRQWTVALVLRRGAVGEDTHE